ncbi:hypothetical protein X949_5587 [Burkholderia pseudomallei MSHR5609]|uniref:Uncharacterized protein n=1 Tax=Burkholderia pseudomallei 1710a TaxID=320371 RepID=A0A0E1VRR3_BURPE|nr:hypothetical protein BUH_4684 [Burkholderia pseudomallei Pakistan 9]EES20884.1 hypothetical protein BURPS1106B_1596 [Burkholderia pseudomallei 1106b]EET03538.1 hypothetical protein BURPS1710A_A2893 [Burkholderia pseudomallei 1710a]KGS53762.1 hypothetical protein X949_5587 [Burkholderia pseudomallei MSHR5609]
MALIFRAKFDYSRFDAHAGRRARRRPSPPAHPNPEERRL